MCVCARCVVDVDVHIRVTCNLYPFTVRIFAGTQTHTHAEHIICE